jgi:hypothetical protein
MSDSPEFRTLKECTSQLETALKRIDGDLVHFLNRKAFIDDDVEDRALDPVTLLTEAQKARDLVKGIKQLVKMDPPSYHVLLGRLKEGGKYYEPIVRILEKQFAIESELKLDVQ